MKTTLYEKVKYIVERLFFHGSKFVKDAGEVFKNRINTAEEAKELLKTSAKVKDMYEISDAIHGVYCQDGKIKTYMPSDEYTVYDVGTLPIKLYYFNGQKSDFINDEELIKLYKILKPVNLKVNDIYCLRAMGKYQFYFLIKEGKNGVGDFVDDDMKNIVDYLDKLKESGATWRCVTDVAIDIPDDVSTWVITFTID